jgi:apolipoprotein D and lipocalin family protein
MGTVFSLCVLWAMAARASEAAPLQIVPSVDLVRYSGKWFEIARLPNRFQDRCTGDVTATYAPMDAGRLRVVNECRTADGTFIRAEGEARRADENGPASTLLVRFAPAWLGWLPMVWGDYQIMVLDEEYRYALVGTPDRKYLWVLSRTPSLDDETYDRLMQAAAAQGFEIRRVTLTSQSGALP